MGRVEPRTVPTSQGDCKNNSRGLLCASSIAGTLLGERVIAGEVLGMVRANS